MWDLSSVFRALRRSTVAMLLLATVLLPLASDAEAVSPTSWSTFYAHERAATGRGDAYFNKMMDAADSGSISGFASSARVLYNFAKREAAWVTSHPPQSCYRAVWGYVRNYWVQTREGASDVMRSAQALDPYLLEASTLHFDRAQGYLDQMESHLPTC